MKWNLLLNVTLPLAEVTMLDFGHFEPFLPTLTSFCTDLAHPMSFLRLVPVLPHPIPSPNFRHQKSEHMGEIWNTSLGQPLRGLGQPESPAYEPRLASKKPEADSERPRLASGGHRRNYIFTDKCMNRQIYRFPLHFIGLHSPTSAAQKLSQYLKS